MYLWAIMPRESELIGEGNMNPEAKKLQRIATIETDFSEKFGIPRQSGLVDSLRGRIVFEPEFCNPDAIRGIEEFSHLWLLWGFSKAHTKGFVPMVTPPRLGGREKKGVFATRSPFRPNGIGLSSVKLEEVFIDSQKGPILIVSGVDLLSGTPIYDIKPYLAYTDAHPEATGSYGQMHCEDQIEVVFPEDLLGRLPEAIQDTVYKVLAQDPRAAYNKRPDYVYGMAFGGYDIRFKVDENVLIVCDVILQAGEAWEKIK